MRFPETLDEAKKISDQTGRPVFQATKTGKLYIPMDGDEWAFLEARHNPTTRQKTYTQIYQRDTK